MQSRSAAGWNDFLAKVGEAQRASLPPAIDAALSRPLMSPERQAVRIEAASDMLVAAHRHLCAGDIERARRMLRDAGLVLDDTFGALPEASHA